MERIVVLDEAGNTGSDLLNPTQPVFVLASVELPLDTAGRLVHSGGRELHFKAARKSREGRQAILRVLQDAHLSESSVRAIGAYKPFILTAKMVDDLVEPLAAVRGHDMYADGSHRAMSNVLHVALPALAGPTASSRLFAAFVRMSRERSNESVNVFMTSIAAAARAADGRLDRELGLLAEGARLGAFGGGDLPGLDPAPPCLMALAQLWAADGHPYSIVHDDRPELQRWTPVLSTFWRDTASQTFTLYDGRSITYPLPITGLTTASSRDDPRIQVADVVAGALQLLLNEQLGVASDSRFAATLQAETRVLDWLVDLIGPSLDLDPGSLGIEPGATPFLADAVAAWTRQAET